MCRLLISRAILFVGCLLLLGSASPAPPVPGIPVPAAPSLAPPLAFEPNRGQTAPAVQWLARSSAGTIFFLPDSVVVALPQAARPTRSGFRPAGSARAPAPRAVRLQWRGASPASRLVPGSVLPGQVHYLQGADPAAWVRDVPTYDHLTYQELYPGIELRYSGQGGQLKSTYLLTVGADPGAIRWRYTGADCVTLGPGGDLQIAAGAQLLTEQQPHAWQEQAGGRVPVAVAYTLAADGSIGFALGAYDPALPLVIDPALIYSTYLGGHGDDLIWGMASDAAGNAYITGQTDSLNFPLVGPVQPAYGGQQDAFVTKLSPDGTLLYSTYLGGSDSDIAFDIAVDSAGQATITGLTASTNFPTANAFQPANGGGQDIFVTRLNSSGAALVYSTYLGGSGAEDNYGEGGGVALDSTGSAYVTGTTGSFNFPTVNAWQPTRPGGINDLFVTKFAPNGQSLVYSTYLGSFAEDLVFGIAVDSANRPVVVGYTTAPWPLRNPYQAGYGGGCCDGIITMFTADGQDLYYSTYLGGNDIDVLSGVAVDSSGLIYVTGETFSANFPLANAYQSTLRGGQDALVTRLRPDGSAPLYSTFLGGTWAEAGRRIAVDSAGQATVVGWTQSTDYPLADPLQPASAGNTEAFVTRFNAAGSALIYSTYLGGLNEDGAESLALDPSGAVHVAGGTSSTVNFPLVNPAQSVYAGGAHDGWVAAIFPQTFTPTPTATGSPATATSTVTPTSTVLLGWSAVDWPGGGALQAVAAPGPQDAWAVGAPGVLHWNGVNWTRVLTTPYTAVSAAAPDDVWALNATTASHWNGTAWTDYPLANMVSIAAVNPSSAFAVGWGTHVAHWNGTTWEYLTINLEKTAPDKPDSPQEPSGGGCGLVGTSSTFLAVTATGPDVAWVAGEYAEHWHCKTGEDYFYYYGISVNCTSQGCVSGPGPGRANQALGQQGANDVWAAGGSHIQTQSAHWDGTAWTQITSPNIGVVGAIAPVAPNDVWMVGGTSALHWTGAAWQPSALPGTPTLNGVAGSGAADVWAGGSGIYHYGPLPTFADVPITNTFYPYVQNLAARGLIGGYPCGGPGELCDPYSRPYFRPGGAVTRGQIAKIVASAAGYSETPTAQTFDDVPPGSTFYVWIERIASRGYITGYPCGGPGEPCHAPTNRPYFRPGNPVTRGQLTKIVANVAGWTDPPTGQTFEDVPPTGTFYLWIERMASRGIIGGYPCGGGGEPCVPPDNRPYFRPNNNVTRGQSAKIVANTFFPSAARR